MKTTLFTTVAAVLSLTFAPCAYAQQAIGDVAGDAATSNSQSGANSNSVGINDNSNGGVTVGPIDASSRTNSTSDSTAQSLSGSISHAEGGAGGSSDARSTATGGNSSATTGASTATANPNANNQGNAQNITFNNVSPSKQKLETNPTVYAPALSTTLTETCMGSTSGGVSVLGFGGTLGTTWNDTQCVRRLNAREMAQTLGDREAARALLCQDKDVARAYATVGQPCNTAYVPRVALNQGGATVFASPASAPPPAPPVNPEHPPEKPTATMEPIPNPSEYGERGAN